METKEAQRLAAIIRNHFIDAVAIDDTIMTWDEYIDKYGRFHRDPKVLPADLETVRSWLGY